MRTLDLDTLKEDIPGITPGTSIFIHEAVLVAMAKHGHTSGVTLKVEGTFAETFTLSWKQLPNKKTVKAWQNDSDVANFAAVGLSLLLMMALTDFNTFEVARYGTGIDYWMQQRDSKDSSVFTKEGRLEISGIFKETKSNSIKMRIALKKKQIKKSNASKLPAWISIIALNIPKSKIERQ